MTCAAPHTGVHSCDRCVFSGAFARYGIDPLDPGAMDQLQKMQSKKEAQRQQLAEQMEANAARKAEAKRKRKEEEMVEEEGKELDEKLIIQCFLDEILGDTD